MSYLNQSLYKKNLKNEYKNAQKWSNSCWMLNAASLPDAPQVRSHHIFQVVLTTTLSALVLVYFYDRRTRRETFCTIDAVGWLVINPL